MKLFDPQFYWNAYPDLQRNILKNDHISLKKHFLKHGQHEHRCPSLVFFEHIHPDIDIKTIPNLLGGRSLSCKTSEEWVGEYFTNFEIYSIAEPLLSNTNQLSLPHSNFNMFNVHLNNCVLDNMYLNINGFLKHLADLGATNILLMAGDYPGFGGAATNCDRIQTFLGARGKQTYALYYNYINEPNKKVFKGKDYRILYDQTHIKSALKSLPFTPDLIILKNPVPQDFRLMFKCPVYYFIGGIFQNGLNRPYWGLTGNEIKKVAHHPVIHQINKADMSFCNSYHTHSILKEHFNLNTGVLYTSLFPYYKKHLPDVNSINFVSRKYDYGTVVSNVRRTVKNTSQSADFMKRKEKKSNVIIGKDSTIYKHPNIDCINLVSHQDLLTTYLPNIKYIRQDSFSESSSNLRIEAIFNGCKMSKDKRIIVSSTQYPGYGGAATNAYAIIKYLKSIGIPTVGVFIHDASVSPNIDPDPDKLGDILIYNTYQMTNDSNNIYNTVCNRLGGAPTLALCKNAKAPHICKNVFGCYTVYLVAGITMMNLKRVTDKKLTGMDVMYNTKLINDIKSTPNQELGSADLGHEEKSNKIVDLIVTNSLISKTFFQNIYPEHNDKIFKVEIDTTAYTCNNSFPQSNKCHDIVICASNLIRKEKNNKFLLKVLQHPRVRKYTKIIIGENPEEFSNIPNSTCTGLIPTDQVNTYMGKSKIFLCPSLFDANPNTARQAYFNKCLPIITHNVGYSELYPKDLICQDFTEKEWIEKICYVLDNYDKLKNININYNTNGLDLLLDSIYDER